VKRSGRSTSADRELIALPRACDLACPHLEYRRVDVDEVALAAVGEAVLQHGHLVDRAMPLPDETGAGLDSGRRERVVTAILLERHGESGEAPPLGGGEPAQLFLLQAMREPAG